MFYIVETKEQLNKLSIYQNDDCFIKFICFNDDIRCSPCLIYYRPFSSAHGYILCVNHTETMVLPEIAVKSFINNITARIWVIDSFSSTFISKITNLFVIKMAYTLSGISFPDMDIFDTKAHRYYYSLFSGGHYNEFIPISKHYEKWEEIFGHLDFNLYPTGLEFYSQIVVPIFANIASMGIIVDSHKMREYYPGVSTSSGPRTLLHQKYNLYNSTARPSCSLNGINLMAMSKTSGCRNIIISTYSNGYLVELDYKSYQIKLLADLVDYKFNGSNIHEELAKLYFDAETISPEQYESGKKLTFRYSFGREKIPPDNPFFKQIYALRDKLWEHNKKNGFIISPYSGRQLYNITKLSQILPHLTQCMETERNVLVLQKIYELLKNKRSRFLLYQYDSFLFDIHPNEGTNLVLQIKNIMEEDDYKTTMSFGYNYHEMNKTIIS